MLIRPQQALSLARNNSKLLIFNNTYTNIRHTSIIKWFISGKKDNPYIFFLFHIFSRPSYLMCSRGSKMALLHRVKERKTLSLSAQASFALFSLKVAWSGKSLITGRGGYKMARGASEVLHLQKRWGWAEKSFSHAEGRGGGGEGTNSFEVVLTWELEVLAIVKRGGATSFHPLRLDYGG